MWDCSSHSRKLVCGCTHSYCELKAFSAQDTKAAQEVAALQAFHAMLGQDSARAFYGPGHVRAAHELGAIQTLLISDTLFRVNDVAKVSLSHCHPCLLGPSSTKLHVQTYEASSA